MYPQNVRLNTPVPKKTKMDWSHYHVTTARWCDVNCAFIKEVTPETELKVNMQTFTRLNPMPIPTFGKAKVYNRWFFVPMRTIYSAWNDFKAGTPHTFDSGVEIPTTVPVLKNSDLCKILAQNANVLAAGANHGQHDYDFVYGTNISTYNYYKLTAKGRHYYKLMTQLGYQPLFFDDSTSGAPTMTFNALPLLAVCKVFYDYYETSEYINNLSRLQNVREVLEANKNGMTITDRQLEDLFDLLYYTTYNPDYFVSAWDRPEGPNIINDSFDLIDYKSYLSQNVSGIKYNNNVNTPRLVHYNSSTGIYQGVTPDQPSQYILEVLHNVSDYAKRHQIAGGRMIDTMLADFGVKLDEVQANRSYLIAQHSFNIQFGDVMAMAGTNDNNLGSYAGKGIGYSGDNNMCNISSGNEFGYVICLSTIIPEIGYYQGASRDVYHRTRFDFFTHDFDALGCQAISQAEVVVPMKLTQYGDGIEGTDNTDELNNIPAIYSSNPYEKIFGYVPRYAEYKVVNNKLSGDFRVDSVNAGMGAWHLMRNINPYYYSTDHFPDNSDTADYRSINIVHSRTFMQTWDSGQYNRIFYAQAGELDNFNVIYNFQMEAFAPVKSLYDDYDWVEKGKEITLKLGGSNI